MTVLVALKTKDSLVMGCDSLGSVTRQLVDPFDLVKEFFDPNNEWKLKTDKNGNPVLKSFNDVVRKAQIVPFDHMTHVTKLFPLAPLEMGVMTTGIHSIKERTVKSLIGEFKSKDKVFSEKPRPKNYTVKSVGKKLLTFINEYYLKKYREGQYKPPLEFMICGYDKQKQVPSIHRIYVHENKIESTFKEGAFGIAFGGQTQEIQRIVFGTDGFNRTKLSHRVIELLNKYQHLLQKHLEKKGASEKLLPFSGFGDELHTFKDWDLDGFDANWGDFSEQNAIECVDFFVGIMIKSQQFSSSLPTVGGNVHIAMITKEKGFKFISKEEYEHEGHLTPIER